MNRRKVPKMAVKAIGYKAILKPDEVLKYSKGGIALAVDARLEANAQVVGTIIDLGEDFAVAYKPKTPQWGLKVGDKVYYAKYAGKWVTDPITEEEFLIVNDEDICAKVEGGQDGSDVVATKEA